MTPEETKRRYTFKAELRLKKSEEFKRVMKNGRKIVFPNFVVFLLHNGLSHIRLGITVSKSTGKAHVRNRIKRLIREYYRLHQHDFKNGLDIVVIARKGASQMNYAMIEKELSPLIGEC